MVIIIIIIIIIITSPQRARARLFFDSNNATDKHLFISYNKVYSLTNRRLYKWEITTLFRWSPKWILDDAFPLYVVCQTLTESMLGVGRRQESVFLHSNSMFTTHFTFYWLVANARTIPKLEWNEINQKQRGAWTGGLWMCTIIV